MPEKPGQGSKIRVTDKGLQSLSMILDLSMSGLRGQVF